MTAGYAERTISLEPRLKAVLFDLDGVLIDSYRVWFALLNHAAAQFGFPAITLEAFAPTWGQGIEADVRDFFPGTPVRVVRAFFQQHYTDHLDAVRADPAGAEVLAWLRHTHGLRTACVTNTLGRLARLVLQQVQLLPGLEEVIGADDAGASKPDPAGILEACARLGVKPEEAVMVGDGRYDLEAAVAAGAGFVGVGLPTALSIADLSGLPPLVTRLLAEGLAAAREKG